METERERERGGQAERQRGRCWTVHGSAAIFENGHHERTDGRAFWRQRRRTTNGGFFFVCILGCIVFFRLEEKKE